MCLQDNADFQVYRGNSGVACVVGMFVHGLLDTSDVVDQALCGRIEDKLAAMMGDPNADED